MMYRDGLTHPLAVGSRVRGVYAAAGESAGSIYPASVAEVHEGGAALCQPAPPHRPS